MDVGGMGMGTGMDMGSEGPFRPTNIKIAHGLWYGIACCVGLAMLSRLVNVYDGYLRRQQLRKQPDSVPSRPRGLASQALCTVTAIVREASYPQPLYFTGRFSRHFSPLPVGRWLVLSLYWLFLLCALWTGTILSPSSPMYGYKWEIVGFRAAWISVAQIPFICLLSCKYNPITLLTGISYERFNWLHRWAARSLFLTVTVHWSFFYREWSLADFVKLELQMMPMVKYGFGAWAVLGWMFLSGLGVFRTLSYEIFVAQHICAAATLLWLVYVHVPAYARYNVLLAAAFLAFDWGIRITWAVMRNLHLMGLRRPKTVGYVARVQALSGDRVRLTIDNADFTWRAGQHMYLAIPRLRPFELHPFTIANSCQGMSTSQHRELRMLVKAHAGFSRSLLNAAVKSPERSYLAFLSGPWGSPPDLRGFESVVMVACSTGASFTIPLLQQLKRESGCVKSLHFHWLIQSESHIEWFEEELLAIAHTARSGDLLFRIVIHVTRASPSGMPRGLGRGSSQSAASSQTIASSYTSPVTFSTVEKDQLLRCQTRGELAPFTVRHTGRPALDSIIRPVVESAFGETAVVVCGGLSIAAQARTYVAQLSDERAVHKGSGAQGIYLHTETYGY